MDSGVAELVTFTSKEAYVYAPLPAATSYGHRAELWNPDKWLQEVKAKVITAGDCAFVRLLDKDSGELFAECPLPHDGTPLTTAVEPVVDSSRYFVVKVVDRDSRKHAFVGLGFRDRLDASDFSAALDDYRQYLRRKQEAEQMRQGFENLSTAGHQQPNSADGSTATAAGVDYSLRPGQTIKLTLSSSLKRTGSGKASSSSSSTQAEQQQQQQQQVSPGSLRLAPPPAKARSRSGGTFFTLQQNQAAAAAAGVVNHIPEAPAGSTDSGGSIVRDSSLDYQSGLQAGYKVEGASTGSGTAVVNDEDWGEFVS